MDHETVRELLPLYVLAIPEQEGLLEIQEHLAGGCESCLEEFCTFESVAGEIGFSIPPVQPRNLLARILSASLAAGRAVPRESQQPTPIQVWRNWLAAGSTRPFVRSNEGAWEVSGDDARVQVKRLSLDTEQGRVTMLVRMAPGKSYPSHRHAEPEECYVLDGDLHVGDLVLRSGDFQRAEAGSIHPTQYTEEGCLLLITCSLKDEILV